MREALIVVFCCSNSKRWKDPAFSRLVFLEFFLLDTTLSLKVALGVILKSDSAAVLIELALSELFFPKASGSILWSDFKGELSSCSICCMEMREYVYSREL
jgi:hypothetical protein